MRLLCSLGPLKCLCRVVAAFFLLALLIFPAAGEPAPPPISGSNGLMGLWGANSSESQTGSSGKPISGSNDQQDTTAPGTPTESSPPDAELKSSPPDAELESSPPSEPRNFVPSPSAQSGSNGLIEWSANSSAPQTGSSGKPISGAKQGTNAPGTPTESSPPDAELKSSPPDAELESSPPSEPRNFVPSPSAQSGSNGLIEWSANSSESQTGSSTDLSVAPSPSAQSGSNGRIEWDANSSTPPSGSSTDLSVAPSPSAQSGSKGSMGEWGTSGSAAQTGASAYTSGRAFKVPNSQDATVQSDSLAPAAQTESSSALPELSLEPTGPPASKVLVIIDKPTQKMKVFVDDVELYSWKVSSGLPGYATPSGTYTASSMNEIWYSKEWDDAPMPHAIFFTKKGHAIHGTKETKKLGRPASHGCVRLAPEDARTLFALVKEKGLVNTEIVLKGDTPGVESKVARTGPRKQQINRAKTSANAAPGRREFEKPRRFGRRDWFQRRFSGRPRQGFYWRY
jgi:lipoprotein-anchoring transpeptidase ErfK/SrfK